MGIQTWPKIKTQDAPWRLLVLLNGWIMYDPPNWPPPSFCRIDGRVYLKGLIRDGNAASETQIAYLPAGFRPSKQIHVEVNSANAHGAIGVRSDGTVVIKSGVSTWFALDSVSFIAEDYQWQ